MRASISQNYEEVRIGGRELGQVRTWLSFLALPTHAILHKLANLSAPIFCPVK